MNFDFTEQEENFRKEVRGWLERNLPDDLRGKAFAASRADVEEVKRLRWWQKKMYEAGYVGMDWPVQFGGRGASLRCFISIDGVFVARNGVSPASIW